MRHARTPQLALFDDEPARPVASRTPEQREATLNQLLTELRACEYGVTGLRLAEVSECWREDLDELDRRGCELHRTAIEGRFWNVILLEK